MTFLRERVLNIGYVPYKAVPPEKNSVSEISVLCLLLHKVAKHMVISQKEYST